MISVVLTIALIVLVAIFIMRTVALKEKIEDLEWQLLKLKSVDDRLSRLELEFQNRETPKVAGSVQARIEEPVIRSEERRVKSVDLGGRRNIKKKKLVILRLTEVVASSLV